MSNAMFLVLASQNAATFAVYARETLIPVSALGSITWAILDSLATHCD